MADCLVNFDLVARAAVLPEVEGRRGALNGHRVV